MNKNINKANNHLLIKTVSLLIVMLLAGCGSIQLGRDFNTQDFESIAKVGETTKTQVLNKLGNPKNTGVSLNRNGERLLEWVYFYASGKLTETDDAKLKILQIRFDQNGIIRNYNWSDSNQ